MCPQLLAVVGTDHYSDKIATTTSHQSLQIHLQNTWLKPHTTFLDPVLTTTIPNLGTSLSRAIYELEFYPPISSNHLIIWPGIEQRT